MKLNLMKFPGGKGTAKVQNWILSNFPEDYVQRTYIEPCGGAANILLNKEPSLTEAYNDIDFNTFCAVFAAQAGQIDKIQLYDGCGCRVQIEYSDAFFNALKLFTPKCWSKVGFKEYVLRNMSRSGLKKDFAWSERKRGGKPGDVNAWENKLKKLSLIQQRLAKVNLYNEDIFTVLRRYNTINSFAYIDPPYVSSTRVTKKLYDYEMTNQQHWDLCRFLAYEWEGLALVSNYSNIIYDGVFLTCSRRRWTKVTLDVANSSGQTKKKTRRVECLYRNY